MSYQYEYFFVHRMPVPSSWRRGPLTKVSSGSRYVRKQKGALPKKAKRTGTKKSNKKQRKTKNGK